MNPCPYPMMYNCGGVMLPLPFHLPPQRQAPLQHGGTVAFAALAAAAASVSENVAPSSTIIAERFKTKPCQNHDRSGHCKYETRCMFAHGAADLRTKEMNIAEGLVNEEAIKAFQQASVANGEKASILAERFKTKMCQNFQRTGDCAYKMRCMFAHGNAEIRTKEMNLADGLVSDEAIRAFRATNFKCRTAIRAGETTTTPQANKAVERQPRFCRPTPTQSTTDSRHPSSGVTPLSCTLSDGPSTSQAESELAIELPGPDSRGESEVQSAPTTPRESALKSLELQPFIGGSSSSPNGRQSAGAADTSVRSASRSYRHDPYRGIVAVRSAPAVASTPPVKTLSATTSFRFHQSANEASSFAPESTTRQVAARKEPLCAMSPLVAAMSRSMSMSLQL